MLRAGPISVVSMTLINLPEKIKQLQIDRKKHAEAIAAIDQAVQRVSAAIGTLNDDFGSVEGQDFLQLQTADERLRSVRRKGKFSHTAEVSVREFIRRMVTPTTAQINGHWRAEGRCGTANVTILKLLQQKRVQRVADPNVRGSRYVIAQEVESGESQASQDTSLVAN